MLLFKAEYFKFNIFKYNGMRPYYMLLTMWNLSCLMDNTFVILKKIQSGFLTFKQNRPVALYAINIHLSEQKDIIRPGRLLVTTQCQSDPDSTL